VPVPNGKITVSLADVQGLVLYTHAVELRQQMAGKIWLGLELPLLPLKPGEYILSCTILDGIHPVAFLRATPELTVQEEENAALFRLPRHPESPGKALRGGTRNWRRRARVLCHLHFLPDIRAAIQS
jgi:hypothetical protein